MENEFYPQTDDLLDDEASTRGVSPRSGDRGELASAISASNEMGRSIEEDMSEYVSRKPYRLRFRAVILQ